MTKVWNYKSKNGTACFSDYVKSSLLDDQKNHEGAIYQITRKSKESKKGRGFLHGGVYTIWAYLDGKEYRNHKLIDWIHDYAKKEFNGTMLMFDGKRRLVGKTTKGMLPEFTEKIIEHLEENYGIKREDVLNPEDYKYFVDKIYSTGKYDDYIIFLVDTGKLKKR